MVLDDGGPAIRVRTVTRRPMSVRWSKEKIQKVRARPRNPNPVDEEQTEPLPERLTRGMEIEDNGDELESVGKKSEEIVGRTFRITESLLEKYGRTEGCSGCEATLLGDYHQLSGSARRHTDECRARIITMMEGTEDNVRIRRKVQQAAEKNKEEEEAEEEN